MIAGPFPDSMQYLTKLSAFSIYSTHIHSSIPSAFCDMSSLFSLNMESAFLTGTLPECFGLLPRLDDVSLAHNHIAGNCLSSLQIIFLISCGCAPLC